MRIVQVIPVFGFGGAETMCANLSIELAKLGNTVKVISLYDEETPITDYLKNNNIDIVFLNKHKGLQLSIVKQLIDCFKDFKPDVVHTHLYAAKYAQLAAIALGVKAKIHTIHNVASHSDGKANQMVNRLLFSVFNVSPVALSSDVKKTVVDFYGLEPNKVPVVLNGVPVEKCKPVDCYKEKAVNIIHVGRFSEQKNHKGLIRGFIEAHSIDSDLQLFLYGEGELQEEIKKAVEDANAEDCIHFCGTTDDIYSVMHTADMFVLPSLWEGIPMTMIEAMGTGLPIIASNVGGIPNMINNGEDGIIIDLKSDDIANEIISLANDKDLRIKLGTNALKHSADYSSGKMAENYLSIYEKKLGINE